MDFSVPLELCPADAVAPVDAVGEHGQSGGFEAEFAVFGVGGLGPAVGAAL
jgi:hypothetical protein